MKCCQIIAGLVIHTQNFHLKTKLNIAVTHLKKNIEFLQDRIFVDPKTNRTENTQNPLEIIKPPYSLIFTEQVQNPSPKLQQHFSKFFH